jgi:hypothetical protein
MAGETVSNQKGIFMVAILPGPRSFRAMQIAIAAIFLFIIIGYPILALTYAAHDDALFLRGLENILSGEWLGSYDNRTLVKGPFLPILGASAGVIGIHAKFLEAILYASVAVTLPASLRRYGLSRTLVLACTVLLLSNPHIWSFSGRRYLREVIYTSSAMMLLLLTVAMLSERQKKAGALYAFGVGCSSGILYLTREEDIWMLSCITLVIMLAGLRNVLRNGFAYLILNVRTALVRAACIALGFGVFVGPILVLNSIFYGRAIVSEFRDAEFKSAIGALMRVGEIHPSGYVPVPKVAMQLVIETIPAAASLRPYWESVANEWSKYGEHVIPDYRGEIAGGWFIWAFRDAVAAAGHHNSALAARNFYSRLASELNAACDQGTLECRARRDTLAPELPRKRIPEFLSAMWRAVAYTVYLSSDPVNPLRSTGDSDTLHRWSQLIGPVVESSVEMFGVSGWVAHPSSEPIITALTGSPVVIRELTFFPGTDVITGSEAQGIAGVHAVRFNLVAQCIEADCAVRVIAENGDSSVIALAAPSPGPILMGAPFWGYIDVSKRHTNLSLAPNPLEGFRQEVVFAAVSGVRFVIPLLVVTATLGLLAFPFFCGRERRYDWLAIIAVGAASAVLGRCILIAYIDVTSWHAVNVGYLGPAYPFVIVFAIAGTQLLFKGLRSLQPAVETGYGEV